MRRGALVIQAKLRSPLRAALLCALALLGLSQVAAAAEEPRSQPLLLPMKELLKQLDAKQEWMLLPLDDYRKLIAEATAHGPPRPGQETPAGAWIESAEIRGVLRDDRELALTGRLLIDSVRSQATRCRLFAAAPPRLGAITIDGQPALYAVGGDGLDLLVPGPGRHQVELSWSIVLDGGDDKSRRGTLSLPLAGGTDLRLHAATPGAFSSDQLAETALAEPLAGLSANRGEWRLVKPCGAALALAWHPGRMTANDDTVFGVQQVVQVRFAAGQSPFRWVARLEPRRGEMPPLLRMTLPAGWTMTTPGAGVVAIEGGLELLLRIDPKARELSCDGFIAADAALALPQVHGAAYAGGLLTLDADGPLDYTLPAGWRVDQATTEVKGAVQPTSAFHRVFVVPGADAGVRVASIPSNAGATVEASAAVLVGPKPDDWRIDQIITISGTAGCLFEVPLQLPRGWRLDAFSSDHAAVIPQVARGDDFSDLAPGSLISVKLAGGGAGHGELKLAMTLKREDHGLDQVALASVPTARRTSQRLVMMAAPGIDLHILASEGWRLNTVPEPYATRLAPLARAELLATGSPPPITLAAAVKPPTCEAEAVIYLLPGLLAPQGGAETWCRLDLRVLVREGELDGMLLEAPFQHGAKLHLADQLFTVSEEDGHLLLRPNQSWRGEHLLRVEGPLDTAAAGRFPQVRLSRSGPTTTAGVALPLRQAVVLQAPPNADLVLAPGAASAPLDEDDLPAWSKPIPGAPVFAAYRCTLGDGAALGGFSLVERPLAPAPNGFLDQVELRTQVSAAGVMTLLHARVAAPAAQALTLGLPEGACLLQATVDGLTAAVRQESGGLVLPLPGRTQVQIALLYSTPVPSAAFKLAPPRLGGLPVTRTTWLVATDEVWRVRVVDARDAMPLSGDEDELGGAFRPWFGDWHALPVSADFPPLPSALPRGEASDARTLAVARKPESPRGEPTLALAGHFFRGERVGGDAAVRLHLDRLDQLRTSDRAGRIMALVLGVLVAVAAGWRVRVALGCAAVLSAVALHHWQFPAGPCLALAEVFPIALTMTLLLLAGFRRLPGHERGPRTQWFGGRS